jgi:G3E family GTPase
MSAGDGRVRLTILGGYLGSGKTTWLRHQLHEGQFKGALVIVNEAAETPIDDALLAGSNRLETLAGGCVCCAAKQDLIDLLRRIADERSQKTADQDRLGQIVLETSGLADPGAILDAIRTDPVLVHHIMIGEVIVAVDALHGMSQFRGEPLSRRQAEVADRLIVTKLDAVEGGTLRTLLATLRAMSPGARLSGAVKGVDQPLPDVSDASAEALPDLSGQAPKDPILPTRLSLDDDVDWTAFAVWLSALLYARGDDVVRVKGVVRTPAGRLLLQAVRKSVQAPELLPEQEDMREDNVIVMIGRGFTEDQLQRSLKHFVG